MDHTAQSVTKKRLEGIKARLSGLGRDADVKELFTYIAGLEDELETLAQYYEEFVIPDVVKKAWAARVSKTGDREHGR
jgi:hypothetical protein